MSRSHCGQPLMFRSQRQTHPHPAGYRTQTATSASGVFWKGRWTDLELLLELAVETCQHRVGFLVFTDRHLDLPLLFGQQPEGEFYPHLSGFQFISALVQSTT